MNSNDIFDKIDRGILLGSKQVIDTAKRTKTPIVVSDDDGNIIQLTTRKALNNYNKALKRNKICLKIE